MSTLNDQKVHSGHSIELMFGKTLIGKAQGLEGDRSFGTEGVYQIGSIMPSEHITNKYEGSLTVERFFVRTGSLPVALNEDILTTGVITINVVEKDTVGSSGNTVEGKIIRSYKDCTLVNCRETFRANAICGENATWTYLSCSTNVSRL